MDASMMEAFLAKLYSRRARGIKLGLETMEALLEELHRPQDQLAILHIAGTNGKGSVAAMLAEMLRQAGFRTGLYTSPHLTEFNERFQIDGEPVANPVLAELLEEVDAASDRVAGMPDFRQPTFFEFATAVALVYFQRAGARLVALETGLGGRLDATNVVTPLVSVITSIGVDHTSYLGNDLLQIAREKAGIIKPGRPVVCGVVDEAARTEIHRVALDRSAPWILASEAVSIQRMGQDLNGQKLKIETAEGSYPVLRMPLLGAHQVRNAATAVAVAETLSSRTPLKISREAIHSGLASVRWPGRAQVLQHHPPMVLDSAHNPAGARAVRTLLRELFEDRPVGLILGAAHDKDIEEMIRILAPIARRCWTVSLANNRSADPRELARLATVAGVHAEACPLPEAITAARSWAAECGGAICICGSVYLAGEVLRG